MERSSFFDAILDIEGNPDRSYLAEDIARFFGSLIGNGVFPNPSSNLQVVANNDMTITVKKGSAWINGYFYENTDDLILYIDPADGVLNRVDRIALRLDFLDREIRAVVKQGDFGSSPVAPELQRDADAYELALADIKINKGAISITQANITDLRLNKELCGMVHGVVDQVDTTTLFNQYASWYEQTTGQAELDIDTMLNQFMSDFNAWYTTNTTSWSNEFTVWFDSIKGQLEGDVAANLAAQMLELQNTKVDKVLGKNLSTNDYSDEEKQKVVDNKTELDSHLADIVSQAEPNKIPRALENGKLDMDWIPSTSNVQVFNTSGNWVKPEGVSYVYVEIFGAGGGGGGGGRGGPDSPTSDILHSGGGGGGGGGACCLLLLSADRVPQSVPVIIGAGGSGGLNTTAIYTGGGDGSVGNDSKFGELSVAGGMGGIGGKTSTPSNGGAGGLSEQVIYNNGGIGGRGGYSANGSAPIVNPIFGGAGGGGGAGKRYGSTTIYTGGKGGVGFKNLVGGKGGDSAQVGGVGSPSCGGGGGGGSSTTASGKGGAGGGGKVIVYAW